MKYTNIINFKKGGVMINKCTHCGSKDYVKDGHAVGKQRFKCKTCGRKFGGGVHSDTKKDFALMLYMNNTGIRKIGKIVGVAPSVVIDWIRKASDILRRKIGRDIKKEEIDVIELDEIYTYVKKNLKGQQYGLLIVDGKGVLLRLS